MIRLSQGGSKRSGHIEREVHGGALSTHSGEVYLACGVVSLASSKTGQRTGAKEAIALRDSLTLQLLDTLQSVQRPAPGELLWPHSAQHFRQTFRTMCEYFQVEALLFKPYSLRRGGATFLLQSGVPLETILIRERWKSVGVARLYLEDGLAQLPSLRLNSVVKSKIHRWASETPRTAFKP